MYGHAPETLKTCDRCPPWDPRWAIVRTGPDDAPVLLCGTHWDPTEEAA